MRRLFLLAGALLLSPGLLPAQESAWREDMRFVEALRARNESDLALEFLKQMASAPGVSPDLLKELPLEFAKTRLRVASEEPESGKRLELYRQAREDFARFITANPGHPRSAEANLEIARVLNLQGKTELNRAYLNPELKGKQEEGARARATLEDAAKRLEAALVELQARRDKLPDPETVTDKPARKKIQADIQQADLDIDQTKLDIALNLFDRSQTYIQTGAKDASALIEQSVKMLKPLDGGPANNPITWKARAWLGRCYTEVETGDKAREKYQQVIKDGTVSAAAEGQRIARYFRMLLIRDQPTPDEAKVKTKLIQESAEQWRRLYPNYKKTPEGFGVAFLLANIYLQESAKEKLPKGEADRLLTRATDLIREVESSENEFTERARNLKISAYFRKGAFNKKVADLKTFEECYLRAQYELFKMGEDSKEIKGEKELEAKRKERIETVIAALRSGLTKPDGKPGAKGNLEVNTARSTLAYWCLDSGKLEEAIEVGESFARGDPRSSQAALGGVYALDAYLGLIARKQKDFAEVGAEKAAMLRLAQYLEQTWPNELPGNLGRHQIALQLMRDENFAEAVKKFGTITPSYPSYAFAQFQLAETALKADKAKAEPIQGDRPGDYRKRALAALEAMPEPAPGSAPPLNHVYLMGKTILGREMFKSKRFGEMNALSTALAGRVAGMKFNADEENDKKIRAQLQYELVDIGLFAKYGLADAAFTAGDHAKVVQILDPLVDLVAKAEDSQEKLNLQKNSQLASVMFSLALRSNLLLGKIDRTDAVLDALDKVTAAEGGGGDPNGILKLLAALIRKQVDEIRKKGDKDVLAKAIKGYTAILDKRIAKQKALSGEFIQLLAECYSSMGQHDRAADVLGKVPEPKAAVGSPEEKAHRAVQILYVRELRQAKTPESLKKATEVMDKVRGASNPPDKRGWGRTDLVALKEYGILLEAKEEYREAFAHWVPIVKQLAKVMESRPNLKELYYECYYHMIFAYYKSGQGLSDTAKRDKIVEDAAKQIMQFEKRWDGFGNDASQKRFTELLGQETALRAQYDKLKGK